VRRARCRVARSRGRRQRGVRRRFARIGGCVGRGRAFSGVVCARDARRRGARDRAVVRGRGGVRVGGVRVRRERAARR